jgi:hypothetical protein
MPPDRWPNLFLVGAARAGTTSFYGYLGQHPEIYTSPLKEPNFFSPRANPRQWVEKAFDERKYLGLFRAARSEKFLAEASTSYLWVPTAAAKIHARCPEAKIIIILREPVERAYSHYLMDVGDGVEGRPFLEVLLDAARREVPSYAHFGLYCEQVRRYLELFGENVLVLFYEEAFADVRAALRRTFRFLEVDVRFVDDIQLGWHHPYAQPRNRASRLVVRLAGRARWGFGRPVLPDVLRPLARKLVLSTGSKPPMDPKARALLHSLYADQRGCLERLLGATPPWDALEVESTP